MQNRRIALWPIIDGRCSCGDPQCNAAGKHPDVTGVTREGAGCGIETGGGLLVLDIDVKKHDGYASLEGREVPDTYAVKTPTGGAHLYYTYPPELRVRNRVNALPGIDIRADGGMVVGAGSRHINGGVYIEAYPGPLAEAPAWLLELARQDLIDAEVPVPLEREDPTYAEMVARCIHELQEIPPVIEGPGGHNTMFVAAQIPVRKYRLPLDTAEQLLLEVYVPRCAPHDNGGPWTPKEVRHKVEQAATKGSRAVGVHDWLQNLSLTSVTNGTPSGPKFTIGQPSPSQKSKIAPGDVLNILLNHEAWRGVFGYDDFRQKHIARNPPLELDAETIGLSESDYTRIANWFEIHGYTVSRTVVAEQVDIAMKANKFHPVVEYLDALPEPSTHWLEDLAFRIYGDSSLWAQRFLTNTLVGAVRRVRRPGSKFDYVPILYGPDQGEGKSRSIPALFGAEFTSEQFPDLSDMVRACMDIQGHWAIEASELHAIRSHKDVEAVKAFISRRVDSFTPKYARNPIALPRQCIFIGTTNEDDFLRDKTGHRRFWPIRVTKQVDCDWIREHRDEIWAEANALAMTDYRDWMTKAEDAVIDQEIRHVFEQSDSWLDKVREYCTGRAVVTPEAVYLGALDTDAHAIARYDNSKQMRIVGCLKQLGCKPKRTKHSRIWSVPDALATSKPSAEEAGRRELEVVKSRAN